MGLKPVTQGAIRRGCWLLLIVALFAASCFSAGVGLNLVWWVWMLILGVALFFMVSVAWILIGMVMYRNEFKAQDWGICVLLIPLMFGLCCTLSPSLELHDLGLRWNQFIKPQQFGPVKILGSLSGDSEALGMAPNGDVFGRYTTSWLPALPDGGPTWNAFIWRNGRMHDLGSLETAELITANDQGQVLVNDYGVRNVQRACIRSEGSRVDLGALEGDTSQGLWMDDQPRVLGQSQTAIGDWHWFLWQAGKMKDLGHSNGNAEHVNSRGEYIFSVMSRVYLCRHNQFTEISSPTGVTSAEALNDHGHVVGLLVAEDVSSHAFLWADGVMTILPGAGAETEATGLNNSDQVVGYTGSPSRACLWSKGQLHYLDDYLPQGSGFHLSKANAINDRGEIVGEASSPDGNDYAFVLKLTPPAPGNNQRG